VIGGGAWRRQAPVAKDGHTGRVVVEDRDERVIVENGSRMSCRWISVHDPDVLGPTGMEAQSEAFLRGAGCERREMDG
jgi:hypothetical protein